MSRCKAVKPDGERCRMTTTLSESGDCKYHDPARREQAQAARRNGGIASARRHRRTVDMDQVPGPLETMADCVRWAAWCAQAVATGALDPKTAREVTSAVRECRSSIDKAELEAQLRDAQSKLRQLKAV